MSLPTCLMGNTWPWKHPTLRPQQIEPSTSRYRKHRNPLTNGYPKSQLMNIRLTKWHLFISGYNHRLSFTPNITQSSNSTRRKRRRNIIWYNPPFSKNVATNVGRVFLKILDDEFPESHALHKIFNRSTVKISYSGMPNLKQKIGGNNKSTLQKTTTPPVLKACNCRTPADWFTRQQ